MVLFTISCTNYLPKAIVLRESALKLHPNCKLVLFLVEREIPDELLDPQSSLKDFFDEVILAKQLWNENFDHFAFRHDITELSTAIKARAFKFLFSTYAENHFVYLDPDIVIYNTLSELASAASKWPIIVTPHHLVDEDTLDSTADNVIRTLMCGIYNLGFLSLYRSTITDEFLNWWQSRLEILCYVDFSRGLFVDQKWIDLAFSFFDLKVWRHPGYNVANWNISKRPITRTADGQLLACKEDLVFVHFSGIDLGKDLRIFKKYSINSSPVIIELRSDYKNTLLRSDKFNFSKMRWSYERFESGEKVSKEARLFVRKFPDLLKIVDSPYCFSNEYFLSNDITI